MVVSKDQKIKIQQQYASPAQYEKKEIDKFIQAVVEDKNKRDYTLVILLAYTGCRISEALDICIKTDLFQESRELVIREGKGDKQRTVLIADKVITGVPPAKPADPTLRGSSN